jgi:pectinesterase
MKRRDFLISAAVLASGCAAPARNYDAIVEPGQRIGDAIAAASGPCRILIKRGVWKEKLVIDKPGISLIGEDRAGTVLTFDAASGTTGPNGSPWGTGGSSSVTVNGDDFSARNLTFANGFETVSRERMIERAPNGNFQAVALRIGKSVRRARLEQIDVIGQQDSLLVEGEFSQFRDCKITGSVDFIFGGGHALFEDCDIVSRIRNGRSGGYIAAPSTPLSRPVGLVFNRCRLTAEPGMEDGSVHLGRPWHPNAEAFGACAYLSCWMGAHIAAGGWTSMGFNRPDGTRGTMPPEEARFGEYDSHGPGANDHRRLLTAEQVASLTRGG